MTPQETGATENVEGLIGIRTRRGTLLQGATGAPEESPGTRAGERTLAQALEDQTGSSHRETPQARGPSGEASEVRHVTAALTLNAPENPGPTGGNVLREALASSARSLEQIAGLSPLRDRGIQSLQRNRLPHTLAQLGEEGGAAPIPQEKSLRDRAGGRGLAGETDSQFTLQGGSPEMPTKHLTEKRSRKATLDCRDNQPRRLESRPLEQGMPQTSMKTGRSTRSFNSF